jgi:D-alanyl-D-alanine carboxypeptidase/D-alanyl-D-alanine-endopeptidase (penicillin-binding protein 4)
MVARTPVNALIGALLAVGALLAGVTATPAVAMDVPPDYSVLPAAAPEAVVDDDALRTRVRRAWSDAALGSRKSLAVDAWGVVPDLDVDEAADTPLMPASTTKLLTAAAVLKVLGPSAGFETAVTRQGRRVFLVGGGDPQLTVGPTGGAVNADASLARLARLTADALTESGTTRVRVRYDDSLFGAPSRAPFWRPGFPQIGVVAPITALCADGGRLEPPAAPRSPDPSMTAAQAFAGLLADRGVEVVGAPGPEPARGPRIAVVRSAPLADLVEHMLLTSDNTQAEILAHHVGGEVLDDPTFAGGARATVRVLDELGVDTDGLVLNDGSGLSRANRISGRTLLSVLRVALDTEPERLWPVYTGLPVAAFDGSLAPRFGAPRARAGRGAVTGKTGTLTGASTLAGLISDRDGQVLLYAVMTNRVNNWASAAAIDRVASRIAGCGCAPQE